MIASFRHRGLKALYEGRTARRVAPEHVAKLLDILAALDFSSGPAGMELPAFRLHALRGRLKGHYATAITTGSRIPQDRRSPTSEGYAGRELQHDSGGCRFAISAVWRAGHLEVLADLPGEIPVDLVVPGNRRDLLGRPVDVEGVVPALTQEGAPMLCQVAQQIPAFHAVTVMGSLMTVSPSASSRANSRLASITRATASRRFVRASSREAPWVLAPGNSSTKAM